MFTVLPWIVVVFSASFRSCHIVEQGSSPSPVQARPARLHIPQELSCNQSLLSAMAEILENVINKRLIWDLDSIVLLSLSRFTFHSGREFIGVCSHFVDDVLRAFCSGDNKYKLSHSTYKMQTRQWLQ